MLQRIFTRYNVWQTATTPPAQISQDVDYSLYIHATVKRSDVHPTYLLDGCRQNQDGGRPGGCVLRRGSHRCTSHNLRRNAYAAILSILRAMRMTMSNGPNFRPWVTVPGNGTAAQRMRGVTAKASYIHSLVMSCTGSIVLSGLNCAVCALPMALLC